MECKNENRKCIINIDLPLIKGASQVDLDVLKKCVLLKGDEGGRYKLDINLPYPVDETWRNAKFDKSQHVLTKTLPMLL